MGEQQHESDDESVFVEHRPLEIDANSLDFNGSDALQNDTRRAAFERLQTTCLSLAEYRENVCLVPDEAVPSTNVVPVNSLVFRVMKSHDPVLVVLPSTCRVDESKLEQHLGDGKDDERSRVGLVPAEDLESVCGFVSGTVPPLGHVPRSIRTLVDASLTTDRNNLLQGGGGHPDYSCLIRVETLLRMEGTEIADIILEPHTDGMDSNVKGFATLDQEKPFFVVEPPDLDLARVVMNNPEMKIPFKPMDIAVVGLVTGVRRMSRGLVFVDLAPAKYKGTRTNADSYDLPWRSGTDGKDMAVQLIAGKTLSQKLGDDEGYRALRRFRTGQLIFVRGRTNVGNRSSLGHWLRKRSLDVIVLAYEVIQEDGAPQNESPPPPMIKEESSAPNLHSSAELRRRQLAASLPSGGAEDDQEYLTMADVFGEGESTVTLVDSMESVDNFADKLSLVIDPLAREGSITTLVGLDCEWKPSFLAVRGELQPVLLLQISIQPIKTVFLFDLQSLLRPCLLPSEPMDASEKKVSESIGTLFASKQLLKIGFHLTADLQKLTSSYPHVEAFRLVHSISDVSSVAKKSMRIAKTRNSKNLSNSLSKLTEYLLGKPLDKEYQVSDWSCRPLNQEQIDYAALDAAISPLLLEKAMEIVDVGWTNGNTQLGRFADDTTYNKSISSVRFMFLDNEDPVVIRKLKAKRAVGSPFVVKQTWTTSNNAPNLPSVPKGSNGGVYTDINGVLRVPSMLVRLGSEDGRGAERIDSLVGNRFGKSKDNCLDAMLRFNDDMPEGGSLEYQKRSGYVEFQDGVALFVNMPEKNAQINKGYPNSWLDEGRSMTWYLRDYEWKNGESRLARKLLGTNDVVANGTPPNGEETFAGSLAVLFVRTGKGQFVCCGTCRVSLGKNDANSSNGTSWGLTELHLSLCHWDDLQQSSTFVSMTSSDDPQEKQKIHDNLVGMVLAGDVVGAMHGALDHAQVPAKERSIQRGIETLRQLVSNDTNAERMQEVDRLLKPLSTMDIS